MKSNVWCLRHWFHFREVLVPNFNKLILRISLIFFEGQLKHWGCMKILKIRNCSFNFYNNQNCWFKKKGENQPIFLILYWNCIIISYWNESKKKIATQYCPVKNTTIFKLPIYVAHNEIKDVIKGFNPTKVKLWTKITIEIWPCKYYNLFSLTWLGWDKWLLSYNYWGGGVGTL